MPNALRLRSLPALAIGSLLALAGLVYLLYAEARPSGRSVKVYCAAALKPVMQSIAAEFEAETGQRVSFDFGDSGSMLGNLSLRRDGDLFLPADDSYVRLAEAEGLVAQSIVLCRMRAVILTRPGNPHAIRTFDDLLKPGLKVGIASPDRAAIGKVVRGTLAGQGKWSLLAPRLSVQHSNVTDSANAVQLGSDDAAIVWDVVAVNYPELTVVQVPELALAVAKIELAVLNTAPEAGAARRLARYIAAGDRGLSRFRRAGFADVAPGMPWVDPGGER